MERHRRVWYAVRNEEGQCSVWSSELPVPLGWTVIREAESKEECLRHIEEVWDDIRPLRSREGSGEAARSR